MKTKTDTEKLEELLNYIESRVKCVEEMDYSFQMAYLDIVHVAERLDSRKEIK